MKVLIVAAHPDDEVLGCGGTIARHAQQGDTVNILILAEGETSRDPNRDRIKRKQQLSALHRSAHRAARILGSQPPIICDFPDNRLDSVDLLDLVKVIEFHITSIKPSVVYTHHRGDLNIDHRIVSEAVVTATRPVPGCPVGTVLFFEVQSSTEWQYPASHPFMPNWYVDITKTLSLKIKALKEYKTEMRSWPHARSIKAASHCVRLRGASVGMAAAEAFVMGRNLSR